LVRAKGEGDLSDGQERIVPGQVDLHLVRIFLR
jgi:hypothetical protein